MLPKILLVDDTRLLVEMEKSFLQGSHVQILTAGNGREALDVVRAETPDLILLDQHMPVMSGVACCTEMRKDPSLRKIPVIIVSSSSSREDLEAFRSAGCNDFLSKPLERHSFLAKVRTFLPAIERRATRVICGAQVTIDLPGGPLTGEMVNLSLTGAFVATGTPPAPGSLLTLSFRLPGDPQNPVITVKGRAVWQNGGPTRANGFLPAGFGFEILDILGSGLPAVRKNELRLFIEGCKKGA